MGNIQGEERTDLHLSRAVKKVMIVAEDPSIEGIDRTDLYLSRDVQKVVLVGGGATTKDAGGGIPGPQGPKGDKGDKGDPGKDAVVEIINNLTAGGATKALSAEMGKQLGIQVNEALNDNTVTKEAVVEALLELDPNLDITTASDWLAIIEAIATIESGGGTPGVPLGPKKPIEEIVSFDVSKYPVTDRNEVTLEVKP